MFARRLYSQIRQQNESDKMESKQNAMIFTFIELQRNCIVDVFFVTWGSVCSCIDECMVSHSISGARESTHNSTA